MHTHTRERPQCFFFNKWNFQTFPIWNILCMKQIGQIIMHNWNSHLTLNFIKIVLGHLKVLELRILLIFIELVQNKTFFVKVSKSRKQFMVSSTLPINKRKQFNMKCHSSKVEFFRSFFGWIEDTISCFRDLLTFTWSMKCRPRFKGDNPRFKRGRWGIDDYNPITANNKSKTKC